MIDFSTGYSYSDILTDMLSQVPDTLDKREGSLIHTALGPGAWYLEGLFLKLALMQAASSVLTASGQDLDMLVANRGLTRKAATPAVRQGTFDAVIPSGSLFKTVNGTDSVGFTSSTLISSGGGTYVYTMTCVEDGEVGNTYTGPIIPAFSGIPGLTTATIGTVITPGTETETDDSLRNRYIASFDSAPYGGNFSTYKQAILAIPGVGAVQIYPANNYNGGGTVLCSIIDDDFAPASAALVQTVQTAICPGNNANGYGIAPIGAAVTIVSGTAESIDVTATVVFEAGVVDGLTLYGDDIKAAISGYITDAAKKWGDPVMTAVIAYPITLYVSRIIYAIIAAVPQVVSVSTLTINGSASDLTLTESKTVQQVPVPGVITVNE